MYLLEYRSLNHITHSGSRTLDPVYGFKPEIRFWKSQTYTGRALSFNLFLIKPEQKNTSNFAPVLICAPHLSFWTSMVKTFRRSSNAPKHDYCRIDSSQLTNQLTTAPTIPLCCRQEHGFPSHQSINQISRLSTAWFLRRISAKSFFWTLFETTVSLKRKRKRVRRDDFIDIHQTKTKWGLLIRSPLVKSPDNELGRTFRRRFCVPIIFLKFF